MFGLAKARSGRLASRFSDAGPVLAVRPCVHTDHYWQVYFDTNKAIRDTLGAAGYPAVEAHMHIRHKAA